MKPMSNHCSDRAPLVAFGAHPDDVEFGCGGVLALEIRAGRPVHLVVCSRGESATHGTPEERVLECQNAATILGASLELIELDGDAHLEARAAHAIQLAGVIRRLRPAIVLAPSLVENQHPDHARLGRLVRDAARVSRYGGVAELRHLAPHAIEQLFFYALGPGAEPRDVTPILVDVSAPEVLAAWTAAMEAHAHPGEGPQLRRDATDARPCQRHARWPRCTQSHSTRMTHPSSTAWRGWVATRADFDMELARPLRIGITCYPSIGGSGILASSLGTSSPAAGTKCISSVTSAPSVCRPTCRECTSTP